MHRKRYRVLLAFVTLVVLLLALMASPGLVLRALGFKRQGAVGEVLVTSPPQATDEPVGEPLDSITVTCPWCDEGIWTCSSEELEVVALTGGLDAQGLPEYQLVFDEAGFNRFFEDVAYTLKGTPYRNLRFDLRDGGLVVYVELDLDLPNGATYLGVSFREVAEGVEVLHVLPFSPADRAGLRAGDIIRSLDNVPVEDVSALAGWIQAHAPGSVVDLDVLREGGEVVLEAELGEWAEDASWRDLGLVFAPDATGSRLVALGLSVGEDLYSLPETGALATLIADAEGLMQGLMDEVVIVGPLEGEARIAQIDFAEDGLVVVMR